MSTNISALYGPFIKIFVPPFKPNPIKYTMRSCENVLQDEETLDELYLSAHAGGVGGKYPIAALLAKFFNGDINTTLEALTMPYHIITGDTQPTSEHFALWSELGEDTPASVVENSRLLPHLDNPEAFHALCRELK